MKTFIAIAAAVSTLLVAAQAEASSKDCGSVPQAQWMSKEVLTQKATELGYTVRNVKVEDGCYEVYGIDSKGARVEAYFHPATGEVVRVKTDD
ncbi:MAG: PepSY domain-containing protein [Nitratireductor sp.]